MNPFRQIATASTILSCLLLAGCASSGEAPVSSAGPIASASAAPVPTAAPEPAAERLPQQPAVEPSEAPAQVAAPTTTAVEPPRAPEPPAPIDARSPDQVVATAGERGQRYLAALRLAGLPPTGMDAAEILYADGACNALAQGQPRPSVLAEFDEVGKAYATVLPMSAPQVAEIYVSTAERTYCPAD